MDGCINTDPVPKALSHGYSPRTNVFCNVLREDAFGFFFCGGGGGGGG